MLQTKKPTREHHDITQVLLEEPLDHAFVVDMEATQVEILTTTTFGIVENTQIPLQILRTRYLRTDTESCSVINPRSHQTSGAGNLSTLNTGKQSSR